MSSVIRIATRSSKLALWQAEHIQQLITDASPESSIEIVHITTTGDSNQTDALRQFGGTGVFTREVQTSVLKGDTDIAVHSLKDLQTEPTDGLTLAGVPERAPTADALLLPDGQQIDGLDELPENATIGTGSPRRQAQLLHIRPDLKMEEIRGNVDTRIRKLDEGQFDAIILAEAGLTRLGLADRISLRLQPPEVLAAVGQGAIGIECRSDDTETMKVLKKITDPGVLCRVSAERALLSSLRAGCHAPLGAESIIEGDHLSLTGVLLSADGSRRLESTVTGSVDEPESIGRAVASSLLDQGGGELL